MTLEAVKWIIPGVALAVGWAFLWWGTGLYWLAGALYAVQVRDLVRAEKAERTAGR